MEVAFYLVLFMINGFYIYLLNVKMKANHVPNAKIRFRCMTFTAGFWFIVILMSFVAYYDNQGKTDFTMIALILIPVIFMALYGVKQVKGWLEESHTE